MNIIAEKLRQAYHNDLTDAPILLDGADEIERLSFENDRLRATLREQRLKPGVRAVITALHRRAAEMNHYPCKQWLNSLGFELGWRLNDDRAEIAIALESSLSTVEHPKS